jgi:hypothetical protein
MLARGGGSTLPDRSADRAAMVAVGGTYGDGCGRDGQSTFGLSPK